MAGGEGGTVVPVRTNATVNCRTGTITYPDMTR